MFYVGGYLMNSSTLAKVHKFGKVGKVIITIFLVISILATAALCAATVFVAKLPEDLSLIHI